MGSKERRKREKDQLKQQRRIEIINASVALFLDRGFIKTTISDIAKACELTNGAIYLYFKNKDELIIIMMTKISGGFGDLLFELNRPDQSGFSRISSYLELYKRTFKDLHMYHFLDAQFNMLFNKEYPQTLYLEDYYKANHRVFTLFKEAFEKGVADKTVMIPFNKDKNGLERSVHMILNVTNSFVEKISLRKELMEREQDISLEEELSDYIDYLIETLRAG